MKTLLIKQPAGLGDILFCQKIAITLAHQFNIEKIIWPVCSAYKNINDNICPKTLIEFPQQSDSFLYKNMYNTCINASVIDNKEVLIVNIDGCNGPEGVLKEKYNFIKKTFNIDINWSNWQSFFELKRSSREDILFNLVNPLNEPFVLINQNVGTPPDNLSFWNNIDVDTAYKKIYMNFIDGYSIFDWLKVVEQALGIYMEGSALTYIIEKLNISATDLHLHSRNHFAINSIFRKPWKKI